ncbi:lipoprotein-releasing ABC transporter ATP-binding protein LolD [Alkalimarinus sediminis]|uniref:Lipoprotein-releasing system ATP-binding protein LolD n=1 Tax=Alkalimarinus sediminis TaxID=1632866 RepID=A0A9E8KRA5_9ALTE|nr:lipoprotein-releasing ABC transporter ATP-binding protein LolD [Alkalimarinus sediminis]UZW76130.1 lipoprotein-releasing ABC transporter ATP-binding protein LolD [Alkalimarinus sediminis]
MSNQIIRAEKLSKSYKEGKGKLSIFDSINFKLEEGESVAILGSSGSGKTTLLNLLGGLDKPNAGTVWVNGHDVHKLSERKKGLVRNEYLGFVYQFHHLLPEFTALENVCMPLLIGKTPKAVAIEKAKELLARVGLSERIAHKPSELSGGERQRVAIARALVNDPKCVLMDEPTGNLDEGTANNVQQLIMELKDQLKTSFVVVTHDLALARKMDRVMHLEEKTLKDITEQ